MRAALVLVAVAAALFAWAVIGWERPDEPTVLAAPPAGLPAQTVARVVPPRAPLIATLLARPLFSPSRRPPTSAVAAAAAAPPAAALPRLAGTIIDGPVRRVVFAGAGQGRPLVLAVGGEVNGFRVQAIESGRVTVIGPTGPQTLAPRFDHDLPPPDAAPPPPLASDNPPVTSLVPGLPDLLPRAPAYGGPRPGAAPMPASLPVPTGTPVGLPSTNGLSGVLNIPGLPPSHRP